MERLRFARGGSQTAAWQFAGGEPAPRICWWTLHRCTGIGVRAYALGRVCCRRTVRRWLAAAGIHRSSTIFVQHVKEKTAKEQPDWIDDAQWISILMVYSHRCALNIQRPITVYKNIYKLLKILCSIWCITSHETHHIQLY
jgi:hypothetical protein